MRKRDPRVDAYIAKAKPFARPILKRIRALVHQACPRAEETLSWGMPFFRYRGTNLCHMAAFNAHASLGFWHRRHLIKAGLLPKALPDGMGQFGKLAKIADLPSAAKLARIVKKAASLIEQGAPSPLQDRARRQRR